MRSQDPQVEAALRDFDALPNSALVNARTACAVLGHISIDTLERRVKSGALQAPTKFPGGRINYWRVEDIRAALKNLSQPKSKVEAA
jgi:hypothetical protein